MSNDCINEEYSGRRGVISFFVAWPIVSVLWYVLIAYGGDDSGEFSAVYVFLCILLGLSFSTVFFFIGANTKCPPPICSEEFWNCPEDLCVKCGNPRQQQSTPPSKATYDYPPAITHVKYNTFSQGV